MKTRVFHLYFMFYFTMTWSVQHQQARNLISPALTDLMWRAIIEKRSLNQVTNNYGNICLNSRSYNQSRLDLHQSTNMTILMLTCRLVTYKYTYTWPVYKGASEKRKFTTWAFLTYACYVTYLSMFFVTLHFRAWTWKILSLRCFFLQPGRYHSCSVCSLSSDWTSWCFTQILHVHCK